MGKGSPTPEKGLQQCPFLDFAAITVPGTPPRASRQPGSSLAWKHPPKQLIIHCETPPASSLWFCFSRPGHTNAERPGGTGSALPGQRRRQAGHRGRQGSVSELGEPHIHDLPAVQTSFVPTPPPTSTGRPGLRPSHNQGNHCPSHPPTGVQRVTDVKSFLISCLVLTVTFLRHQASSLVATKQPQGKCLWGRTLSSY